MNAALASLAFAACIVACAPTLPEGTRGAASRATIANAEQLGVASDPRAASYLARAREECASAQRALDAGDVESAGVLWEAARVDAEIAISAAREDGAIVETRRAQQELRDIQAAQAGTQSR